MRSFALLIAASASIAWSANDTMWINPAPLADSIAGLAKGAPEICAAGAAQVPESEDLGTFVIQRRDTVTVMCKPFPNVILVNALNAAACKPAGEKPPAMRMEVAQVNLQFEEIPRHASRTIRALLDCKVILRNAETGATVRELSIQAEESKIVVSQRRHVEGLVRDVFVSSSRQVLLAAKKYLAE